ncbi:lipoxygenase family protein [Sorangium sp. So ce260]|uniref:lipoxygenase family protein n=1 Tax=Sorangium sp. So ce260 TaxID=3133291 RepID=UPI003F63405C
MANSTDLLLDELENLAKVVLLDSRLARKVLSWKERERRPALHVAVGKLVFSDTRKPLRHITVELRDRDIGTQGEFLGRGMTDKNGCFEIYYDPLDAGVCDAPDLELRIIATRPTFSEDNRIVLSEVLVHLIKGGDQVREQRYDFGLHDVPYWPYDAAKPFPRVRLHELNGSPEDLALGRRTQAYEVSERYQAIKTKHVALNVISPALLTPDRVQADYPPNLTIRREQQKPGSTRADDFFVDRLLNGMNPCLLERSTALVNRYRVRFNWDAYAKNPDHDLHNAEAHLELAAGALRLVQITLQRRLEGPGQAGPELGEPLTFTPADGERWLQAKRVFRTNTFFAAELIEHFVKAHLQMEQYAIAAFRNLNKSPLQLLLFPHLKEVININQRADVLLVSESGYIPMAGPLSLQGVLDVCMDRMSRLDWAGWKPRAPLGDFHTYARIANLYWSVLTRYVDVFFEKHLDGIRRDWIEVLAMSDDLVAHSVAWKPADRESPAAAAPRSGPPGSTRGGFEPSDRNELDDPTIPRAQIGGVTKAVRPVTSSEQASAEDLDRLKQLCRYVLFHTTFWHTWVNDAQPDDGGEVAYSALALRNGSFGPEGDPDIAPTAIEASQLLFLTHVLAEVRYGYILKNEDGDVPEELRMLLLDAKNEFARLGYDVSNIRSRVNI